MQLQHYVLRYTTKLNSGNGVVSPGIIALSVMATH